MKWPIHSIVGFDDILEEVRMCEVSSVTSRNSALKRFYTQMNIVYVTLKKIATFERLAAAFFWARKDRLTVHLMLVVQESVLAAEHASARRTHVRKAA